MKLFALLALAAFTFGCAHETIEQPIIPYNASEAAPHSVSSSAPIAQAYKNYTNGLVSEAFTVLLRSYENTHDLKCLEFATGLSDQEIQCMITQLNEKRAYLKDTQEDLDVFFLDARNDQKGIGNSAYNTLRSEMIEKFSKENFIPRTELVKSKMLSVQVLVSEQITNPNNVESDRLISLQKRINSQRNSLCTLRTKYISKIFIGPRVNLGDKLVFLAQFDQPHIGPIKFGNLNSFWVEKLELLFPKDYGNWIAQSDEQTRLDFKALVSTIKNALGTEKYKDFQATIELLSDNKEGGMDTWWPTENPKP